MKFIHECFASQGEAFSTWGNIDVIQEEDIALRTFLFRAQLMDINIRDHYFLNE